MWNRFIVVCYALKHSSALELEDWNVKRNKNIITKLKDKRRQAFFMEEGNDIIICDEFVYPIDIRLVSYTFEYSTDLQWK